MKKALFLLLTSGLLAAQTSDLLSNNWYISKMVTSTGQTTNTPFMDNSVPASTFNSTGGTSYIFSSKYYNTSPVSIDFVTNTSTFIKAGSGCTLLYYGGNNAVNVNSYDQKNCDFFLNTVSGAQYNYQMIDNGPGKTLIITDPSGNQIHYNSFFLSTHDMDGVKKIFKAYPNPVKNNLNIENIERNLPVKIYDMSGKLVFETKTDDKKVKIETSNLQNGQYILVIENYAPYKFTKE